uniref:Uncharacterized protein n=1 Tax=Mycena chlorophos TaxID=658473 RepID=A0ABQ0LA12_MYCCL|nr:predicted protein [Mycena chlorophos]
MHTGSPWPIFPTVPRPASSPQPYLNRHCTRRISSAQKLLLPSAIPACAARSHRRCHYNRRSPSKPHNSFHLPHSTLRVIRAIPISVDNASISACDSALYAFTSIAAVSYRVVEESTGEIPNSLAGLAQKSRSLRCRCAP